MRFSRRAAIGGLGAAVLARRLPGAAAAATGRPWPIEEGAHTPKICLGPGDGVTPVAPPEPGALGRNLATSYAPIRQLGVTHVVGVPVGDWSEDTIRRGIQTAKDAGLAAYNWMIGVPANILYGEGRAKDLEKFIASIEAAGRAGCR